MDNEVYSFALKTALNEIHDICPEIKNSFMFKEDGEIIAGDEDTSKEVMGRVVDSFNGLLEKGDTIGGIEGIILEGSKGKVNISSVSDFYFLTVTSRKADMKQVDTVTRVLIPTILKLLEKINPASLKNQIIEEEELPETTVEEEEPEEPEETAETETLTPETQVNQLIIEDLGGLLVPSDTVRIDNEILSQWEEFSEDQKIEKVEVETFDGKTTQCKVKPIKDSKYKEKGIIRMPEKIQHDLEIKKGELIRVKPVVD